MASLSTVADVIEKSLSYVLGNDREERNQLSGSHSNSTTTITFGYDLGSIRTRSEIEVGTELMYVWSVNASAKTAVVQRGFKGTTAATHSDLDVVTVNPRFYRGQIIDDINSELDSLTSPIAGIFAIGTTDLTWVSSTRGYTFDASTCIDLLELWGAASSGLTGDWRLIRNYKLIRSLPTTGTQGVADGGAIIVDYGITSGNPIRAIYKKKFTAISAITDALSTTNLPTTAYDILPMGVGIRLNMAREISRNATDSAPDARRSQEVPPGAVNASIRALTAQYTKRINEETARLHAQYPMKSKRLDV